MASKKTLIQRSNVLKHPLGGGQAGISRELGLSDNNSGMLQAWSQGIFRSGTQRFRTEGSLTNLVYDQTMQGTIVGMSGNNGTSDWSEMYVVGNSADTASVGGTLKFQWTEDTLAKTSPLGTLRKAQHLKSVTHSNQTTEIKHLWLKDNLVEFIAIPTTSVSFVIRTWPYARFIDMLQHHRDRWRIFSFMYQLRLWRGKGYRHLWGRHWPTRPAGA